MNSCTAVSEKAELCVSEEKGAGNPSAKISMQRECGRKDRPFTKQEVPQEAMKRMQKTAACGEATLELLQTLLSD